jgi:hypothetical protein
MRRTEAAIRFIAVIAGGALALGGCLGDDCDCPELAPYRIAAGTLRTRADAGAFSATESMVVDRDAGVVTITSTRDGHVVVERWRIADAAIRY